MGIVMDYVEEMLVIGLFSLLWEINPPNPDIGLIELMAKDVFMRMVFRDAGLLRGLV